MSTEASATAMETKGRSWGFLLIEGIAMVIIGAILLWAPAKTKIDTYQLLIALIGIYWIISGVLDLVHMFTDHTGWGWKLFMGIISIIAGIYVVSYPIAAGIALPKIFVLVLGIWGLIYGIVALIMAFKGGGWGAGILGALGLIFGIILTLNPLMGALVLPWVVGILAIIGGIMAIVVAFKIH